MRKEKMVTRTMTTSVIAIMGIDMETASVKTVEISIAGTIDTTDEKQVNAIKEKVTTDSFKPAMVTVKETIEKLYGMTETDFLKYAKELPARTKTEE